MSNTAPVENEHPPSQPGDHGCGSSTRTKRPLGIFDSMKSMCCCVSWSKIAVFAAAGVTALTGCRAARVPCRATWSVRSRRPSRPNKRGVGVAFLAGDRGDIDDAAVVCAQHCRHHRRCSRRRSVEVDVEAPCAIHRVGFHTGMSRPTMAALLTRMSILPRAFSVAPRASSMAARTETSTL